MGLLVVARHKLFLEYLFLGITLLFLSGCNFLEILSFVNAKVLDNQIVLNGLKTYHAFLPLAGACFLKVSLEIIGVRFNPAVERLFAASLLLLLAPLIGDHYITGYTSIGYSVTRTAGEHYWIMQILLISSYVLPSFFLAYGAWAQKEARSKTLFYASLPMVIVMVLTVLLMKAGFKINASGFFSAGTTFFVAVIIYTESKDNRFAILSHLPWKPEFKFKHELLKILSEAKDLDEAQKITADKLIEYHLERLEPTIPDQKDRDLAVANILGKHPRTIRRRTGRD